MASTVAINPDAAVLQSLLNDLRDLHERYFAHIRKVTDDMKAQKFDSAALVDMGYLFRESEKLLDDWRKDCKARKELAETLVSEPATSAAMTNDDPDALTVRGTLAYATCDLEVIPGIPREGTPEHDALMKYLNLSDEQQKFCKLSYEKVTERVKEHKAGERKAIPGITKSWPKYVATFTQIKRKSK